MELVSSLIKGRITALFKVAMLPTLNDKLTMSIQTGRSVSKYDDRIAAGSGSSGETFIPNLVIIVLNSSSVVGLKVESFSMFGFGVDTRSEQEFPEGNLARIFAIFCLKNSKNLFANSVSDSAVGRTTCWVLSIRGHTPSAGTKN